MLKQGRWPRENTVFWEQIADQLDQLRYIEFTGGEPFMIQEHFDMLQRIVDKGIAGNIEIHYNTNGTMYPEHAKEIWRHFNLVEIAFSIDDVGARFEYQRSGAKWEDVQRNIGLFKQMKQELGNIRLQVCSTVNIFNVYYLESVAQWIAEQNFDFVYWNMMHEAAYFSIASLPVAVKEAVAVQLKQASVGTFTAVEFGRIIDFMQQGQSTDGKQTCEEIRRVDSRRGENFKLVEPEFAQLLNYE
jgi:MoaA/NifB/PqqE/SkfB family radical SAM enzyme